MLPRPLNRGHAFALVLALLPVLICAFPAAAGAQNHEKDVIAVVEKLFEGMRAKDTAMMRSVFDPAARLLGLNRQAPGTVMVTSVDQFLRGIGGYQGAELHERIFRPEVRIDGDFATVWAFYTLHVGDRFSHCGVDSFQLFRLQQVWKIVSIADTRRTENCPANGSG
jgi:hypothetical protein